MQFRQIYGTVLVLFLLGILSACDRPDGPSLSAGAYAQDITPTEFPVIVNGGFLSRTAQEVHDRLYARALVLDDGRTRLAIVVVDSCMVPRALLDEAKELAARTTGIQAERMLICSTHTHSAPSVMNGCLGTDADPLYVRELPGLIARSIEEAATRLQPAQVGWGSIDARDHTHNRRWIRRPDRIGEDPFGKLTIRAMMHPGYQSPDYIGPSGPVDPELTILSVQRPDGRPVALLANYSMHYFGTPMVSADYFGVFSRRIGELLGGGAEFVGMMSQGTSGDLMWMDYARPKQEPSVEEYTEGLAQSALTACKIIEHRSDLSLAMAERTLMLGRRLPDEERLAWARQVAAGIQDQVRTSLPQVYAHQQLWLAANPTAQLKLQALRIGDLGITAIPNEVYALTGLKLKEYSPLGTTMNIELANGAEGYIPPPEQHALGGYTTWACSTAGLEIQAEPKIVQALVELLEEVSGRARRPRIDPRGSYVKAVLASRPVAYWRMSAIAGETEPDVSSGSYPGRYEPGFALYLPGPQGPGFSDDAVNRAVHLAGGRMKVDLTIARPQYSAEFWFWNGLPDDARPVTGYLFSLGKDGDPDASGDHLGIGGTHGDALQGRLFVFNGNKTDQVAAGSTRLAPQKWNHVALVRQGSRVRVFLNGAPEPHIDAELPWTVGSDASLFIGGRSDGWANLEGKIDEVAIFGRALTPEEVASHFKAARYQAD